MLSWRAIDLLESPRAASARTSICRGVSAQALSCGTAFDLVDDYDWDQLQGGRFVGFDPVDGHTVVEGSLEDVAWGRGGTAVVLTKRLVCAVERTGSLALYSKDDGRRVGRTPSLASHPLGIAHAAASAA